MLVEVYCTIEPNIANADYFVGKFTVRDIEKVDWEVMKEVCIKGTRDRTKKTDISRIEIYDTNLNLLKVWNKTSITD